MEFEPVQIILIVVAAILVGVAKTGVVGLGVLFVPIMASVFPPKESTGVLLPMLVFADIWAVAYHRRNAQWRIIGRLLPWLMPGIVLGALALWKLPAKGMGPFFAVLVLGLIVMRLVQERKGEWLAEHVPQQWWFSAAIGLLVGFVTMVGNVAGAIMGIYLLSMGLRKKEFMGTGAWYFLIGNTIKLPFSAALGLITAQTLLFDLKTTPLILLGAGLGIWVFRKIPQKWFGRVILILATLSALRLLFRT